MFFGTIFTVKIEQNKLFFGATNFFFGMFFGVVWQLPTDVKIDPNLETLLYIAHILDEKLCENNQLLQVIHQLVKDNFRLRNAKILNPNAYIIEEKSQEIDPWTSKHPNMKKRTSLLYHFNWDAMPEIPHLGNFINCM